MNKLTHQAPSNLLCGAMPTALRRATACALLVFAACMQAACGGGAAEEDEPGRKGLQPVDCALQPHQCR